MKKKYYKSSMSLVPENYDRVDLGKIITFGTIVYIRKDKQALMIIFPCGNELHFKPNLTKLDEI